ncbi:hypothetical protein BDA96_04G356300 [Sorghum bicolor]|uniref:Uncharacterized protein n=1 Tax=Sorghum bicolor TaxID=4558 RepID=A0A921R774_SORBI|nr:hypothetical protein BDA96_04G356300 [Sorghum bicolor]
MIDVTESLSTLLCSLELICRIFRNKSANITFSQSHCRVFISPFFRLVLVYGVLVY